MAPEQARIGPSAGADDRWLPWPPLVATCLALALVFTCRLPGSISFILIATSMLCLPLIGTVMVGLVIVLTAKRLPRRAASIAIALIAPVLFWTPIGWAADCLHLVVTETTGLGQIGHYSLRGGGEAYDWSVGLAGGPNTFLVHDETDVIAKLAKPRQLSTASATGIEEECAGRVQRLFGHYYTCTF